MTRIGYADLAELAGTELASDDFDPIAFCDVRGIDKVGVTQIALEATSVAHKRDTPEGHAAMFIQGFQLGVLVGERLT